MNNKRTYGDTLGPPSRWLKCPRRGKLIPQPRSGMKGGLFIPFKTPLDSRYDDQVDAAYKFTPSMLIDACKRDGIDIGLWVDLTKTSRYYDRSEVENAGIQYEKLALEGHGGPPTEFQVDKFIRLCQRFFERCPDKVVAVHCTHGFNRTGYLICSYLVGELGWEPRAAIDVFAENRPPGIYKQQYLDQFHHKYCPESTDLPIAPDLPEWCFDEADDDDEDEDYGRPGKRRKNEFNKANPTFMEGVNKGVTVVTDFRELARIREKVQSLVGWNSSGFPGAQPVSLSSENLSFLKQFEYMVSWKADGTRYMMLIEDQDKVYFIDRDNSIFQLHKVRFPTSDQKGHLYDTLVDGEMVLDPNPNGAGLIPRFLIFDVVTYLRRKIGQKKFKERFDCIKDGIIEPRRTVDRSQEPISIRRKDFYLLAVTEKVMNMNTGHKHDGLIFQPVEEPYTGGRCPRILKWKPAELNSIDFKLKIVKVTQPGCLPQTIANLYVNGLPTPFASIVINKRNRDEYEQYDGKIVECECANLTQNQWKVMRIRTDKSHPNSFSTAQGVLTSIRDGYDKKFMIDFIRQLTGKKPPPSQHHPAHPSQHHHPPPHPSHRPHHNSHPQVPPPPKFTG